LKFFKVKKQELAICLEDALKIEKQPFNKKKNALHKKNKKLKKEAKRPLYMYTITVEGKREGSGGT